MRTAKYWLIEQEKQDHPLLRPLIRLLRRRRHSAAAA
jgi:hypothetical protein